VERAFWLLLGAVAYAYIGYPALLWLAVRLRGRRPPPPVSVDPGTLPRASILLPAHNEAGWLRRRLENLLALRYPSELVEILVGSDGSTDGTAEVARSFGAKGVRLVESAQRSGKTALLNQMVGVASGDVIVFTDANALFGAEALERLVAPFASPRVGCVVGELVYVNREVPSVRAGEGLYWRFENTIKEMEGQFGGTLVGTGAVYAMRRALYRPLPSGISDDALNPLLVLAAGYDVLVEPRAQAFERAATSLREEFQRKARMVTRQLGAHAQVRFFLKPLRPALAVRLASHKLLRWLAPALMLGALLTNLALLDEWLHRVVLVAAGVGALAFGAGALMARGRRPMPAPLRLWVYFCVVNAAALKGTIDFLRGRERATWTISATTR
jgi:cellulose synthase/poly-beta-1,6-N-acetylglucosamine synthase-like glycosyltransferase